MPPRKPSPVGSHISMAGSPGGISYIERIKAEAVQVFASNPRGWKQPRPALTADEAFATQCADHKIPVFIHAPYLVNLASPTELTRTRSLDALRHSLDRGGRLGAKGVVLHAGAAIEQSHWETALASTRALLLPLLDSLAAEDPDLLIEPTAGGGAPLAATIEDLGPLFDALDHHPRLGICLDTCHAFAAGHDLATPGGARKTLNTLVRTVGRDRLRLVHANDSKDPLGSRRDRHAAIGKGAIGTEPFAELFRHPATRGVPVIVETPGDVDSHRRDIRLLKALRDR